MDEINNLNQDEFEACICDGDNAAQNEADLRKAIGAGALLVVGGFALYLGAQKIVKKVKDQIAAKQIEDEFFSSLSEE